MNVTLNACNVVKDDSRRDGGGGGVLKSSRIKTNSSFTLVQKRHLALLFSFSFFFFIKQACRTKGGGESFLEGGTEAR